MINDFVITFRETLEAALICSIVFSYVSQIGMKNWFKVIRTGILTAIALSLILGIVFDHFIDGFAGKYEPLFEGTIMLIAAGMLLWMILFMQRHHKGISTTIRLKIDKHFESNNGIGIFFLVFFAVLREGIETVLFLKAAAFESGSINFVASIVGVLAATGVGYAFFVSMRKINLKPFFTISTLLLIVFVASLLFSSAKEFMEFAGVS